MARGLRQTANEPELDFIPEPEQDADFVPLTNEELGSLTKAEYLAAGGKAEDVISPEREAVLQQETQRQLQSGATPEQAAIEAGKALDAMGTIRRPDGTIAEGYKPTAQALAEGIIEKPAIPAVKEAQRLGIETVSSGTDKGTGVGFAIGKNQQGKLVRFEADESGNVDSYELEPEEPSRLGAVGRTLLSQVIPTTTGAVAAETVAALTPGGLLPKLVTGAIAGVGGFIAGQKGQEAAGRALLGPERMARISEVLQRDVEKYPFATTAASILTPTIGGITGLARGVRGVLPKQVAPVAEAVAPVAEAVAPKIATEVAPAVATKTFYHGSPSTTIADISEDARGLIFVSESKDVSSNYRLSRTKNIDLDAAGLTPEEKLAFNKYKKATEEFPDISPDQVLAGEDYDIASMAYEKIEEYKKVLAAQGKIYELNFPTDKIIDYRDKANFYKTLGTIEADLRATGQTRLANIVRNSTTNQIPPQSRLLDKPFFDALEKQGLQGITLPHSVDGSETMLIKRSLAPKAEVAPAQLTAAQTLARRVPAEGEKLSKLPARVIGKKLAPEATLQEVAKGDIFYKTKSVLDIEENIVKLGNDEVAILANRTDIAGDVAKVTLFKRFAELGENVKANQYLELLKKGGTDYGQRLNVLKLIRMDPTVYAQGVSALVEQTGYRVGADLVKQISKLKGIANKAQSDFGKLSAKARETLDDVALDAAITKEKELAKALFNLQAVESRLVPKRLLGELLPTVIQGNLLTPLSLVTNLWSNAVNAPLRMASRQGAYLAQEVGRAFQKVIGKELGPRLIGSPVGGITRTIEVGKAGLRGLGEGLVGARRGMSAEGLLAGEKIQGLKPLTAFRQFWTGQGLAKPIQTGLRGITQQVADRARLAAEGILGIPPETMLRLLQLGDAPFRRMAQARLLTEQAQLAGLTGKALKVAVRLPTRGQFAKIEQEAAEAVFQQDTALSRAALNAANLFGLGSKYGVARLFAKTIIPYAKTPANVIDELVEFALPPYALTKMAISASKKDYRQAQMSFGKFLTGTTIGGVTAFLLDNNVIGDKPSVSDKIRDIQYKTVPPRTINVSALQRLASGESTEAQAGDKIMSLEKLGIVGGIMSTWDAAAKGKKGERGVNLEAVLPETLSFAFNQSFLKGTNSLLSAMLDGSGSTLDKWISDYYGVVASIPLPNTLGAVSRSMRETMPDKLQIKDIPAEGAIDRPIAVFSEVIRRKLPGADEDLPRRIDIWGREVPQTPEGADPVLYNFVDVTKGRDISYDPVTLSIYKIFKATEDGDVIPPKPLRDFTIASIRYRLSPELFETYSKMRGKANRQVAEEMLRSDQFKRMNNEDKVIVLRRGYAQIGDDVRKEFLRKYERRIKQGDVQ